MADYNFGNVRAVYAVRASFRDRLLDSKPQAR